MFVCIHDIVKTDCLECQLIDSQARIRILEERLASLRAEFLSLRKYDGITVADSLNEENLPAFLRRQAD